MHFRDLIPIFATVYLPGQLTPERRLLNLRKRDVIVRIDEQLWRLSPFHYRVNHNGCSEYTVLFSISGPHSSKLAGACISRLSVALRCHLYWWNAAHNAANTRSTFWWCLPSDRWHSMAIIYLLFVVVLVHRKLLVIYFLPLFISSCV